MLAFSAGVDEEAGVPIYELAFAWIRLCLIVEMEDAADDGIGTVGTLGVELALANPEDGVIGFIGAGFEGAFVRGVFSGIE
jgi:hypothetical protein